MITSRVKEAVLTLAGIVACRRFQPLAERVHRFCLASMNIGGGGGMSTNGELNFVKKWIVPWFRTFKTESGIAFDVGANKGDFTKLLLENLPSGARVLSFEPQVAAFAMLTEVVAQSGSRLARTFNFALSSRPGFAPLFTNHHGSELASLYQRRLDHIGVSMESSREIGLDTIDHVCAREGIQTIHFLKLDVEGHELDVLHGAHGMLASNGIKIIQWEMGGCNIDSRIFLQDFFYLLSQQYILCRMLPRGIFPIREYRETHEVFLKTNYLGIHREIAREEPFVRYLSQ